MRVDLRGGDTRVPQHLLNLPQICPSGKQVCGKTVPQRVSTLLINSAVLVSAIASTRILIARWMSFELSAAKESRALSYEWTATREIEI